MEEAIEKFLILAKGQKARALETIIDQVLSDSQIFVFAEFIDLVAEQKVIVTNLNSFRLNRKLATH